MKTMIMIETAEELALVERLWKQMEDERSMGVIDDTSYVEGGMLFKDRGSADGMFGPKAIVYHLRRTEGGDLCRSFQRVGRAHRIERESAGGGCRLRRLVGEERQTRSQRRKNCKGWCSHGTLL